MIKKYNNLSEFKKNIETGNINEINLRIILDNDNVSFFCGDEENDPDNFIEIIVNSTSGYSDILELYTLLFPKAVVEWC